MALTSPLLPSPDTRLYSHFSPYTDSPSSPAAAGANLIPSKRSSGNNDNLAPPASPYPAHVDPSPTDSNGTDRTEIEEDAQEDTTGDDNGQSQSDDITSPKSPENLAIDTNVPVSSEPNTDDAPASVIHAPNGFKQFVRTDLLSEYIPTSEADDAEQDQSVTSPSIQVTPSPTGRSSRSDTTTIVSPKTPDAATGRDDKRLSGDVPAVDTSVVKRSIPDRSTPRATTQSEADEARQRWSQRSSGLQDIPEGPDASGDDENESTSDDTGPLILGQYARRSPKLPREIEKLRNALKECWILSKTLGELSTSHRNRMFSSDTEGHEEQVWQSCWKLCQKLYESQGNPEPYARSILDLCRDFSQALFEVRERGDLAKDSVLRVSFELNNHLYNIHDRTLPPEFCHRTLEFFVIFCHRMMKTPNTLPSETDALLKACWALSETLYSIQNPEYEPSLSSEELWGSAVQACWDLTNLFREGWSQNRPERATPKATQTRFSRKSDAPIIPSDGRSSSLSNSSYHDAASFPLAPPPETPVTIFDDVTEPSSPESVSEPNILLLGPAPGAVRGVMPQMTTHHERWSSNASTLSGFTEDAASTSQRSTSSSTRTVGGSDQSHLLRVRGLILKAALLYGYIGHGGSSNSSTVSGSSSRSRRISLKEFVSNMPPDTFGNLPAQMGIWVAYQRLVLADESLDNLSPVMNKRFTTVEIAKAVRWLSNKQKQWDWMRGLFTLVNGFPVEEAERRGGLIVT